MTQLHVLRVFLGPGGDGGNPLGVVLDGPAVAEPDRQALAARLGFSETVFVDSSGGEVVEIRIFTPAAELAFAGHPCVGTAWLLRTTGRPATVLRVPAGDVRVWHDETLTWLRGDPAWVHPIRFVEFATPGEVEDLRRPRSGDPSYYAWAWEDAGIGVLRSRYFPTDLGIAEDEATGAAAVALGGRLGRALTIRQGRGSELYVRPGPGGSVEVGGRVVLDEVRELA